MPGPFTVTTPGEWTCLGYVQFDSDALATAMKLGSEEAPVPAGTSMVQFQVEGGDVRYRGDAGTPTAEVGMLLSEGAEAVYPGEATKLRFITASGTPTLNVQYFKTH